MPDVADSAEMADGAWVVTLAEVAIARAWTVRGNPAEASFVAQVERLLGLPLPLTPMTSAGDEHQALLWLGPRSWLFIAGAPDRGELGGATLHNDFDGTRHAINVAGGALFDVSSSQVAWTISGAMAGRVLNRSCPLDFHADAFPPGHCAQSLLGHVNAVFYRPDASATFVTMVARSFAAAAWHALCNTAASGGYRVLSPAPFPARSTRTDAGIGAGSLRSR